MSRRLEILALVVGDALASAAALAFVARGPESWRWLFEHALEARKPILNYSGGTEISGGILCGNLVEPVKPCGFPGPVVGMDADVVDERGASVRGAVGELVVRQPWIGQTRGFWDDAGDARLIAGQKTHSLDRIVGARARATMVHRDDMALHLSPPEAP